LYPSAGPALAEFLKNKTASNASLKRTIDYFFTVLPGWKNQIRDLLRKKL
jgi:hypothetical protein